MRALALSISLSLTACGYYHEVKKAAGHSSFISESSPGFQSIKAAVFDPYCLACHSQAGGDRGGINLETYTRVLPLVAAIRSSVITGRMPRGSTLPEKEKSFLLAWIDAGAPELSIQPQPDPPKPGTEPSLPTAVDFNTVRTQIFQPHCATCHSSFTTYQVVKANLTNIESRVMANQMPLGGALTTQLKDLLSRWIDAGAPEGSTQVPGIDPVLCPDRHGQGDHPCQENEFHNFN